MAVDLSIILIGFDMARELPRTILSFSPAYQRDMEGVSYEIILVDNGSAEPVRRDDFPPEIPLTILRIDDAGMSPCPAINAGVRAASGERIAVGIDGARLASPGLLAVAMAAHRANPDALVATLGFHLGPKVQQQSTTEGYTREVEDQLLASIDWPNGADRLFEIASLGESYREGLFLTPPETTFFLISRRRFDALGGFDERFRSRGGGFANFDFFERACAGPDGELVLLLGEGTFHQLHYGATTRAGGLSNPETEGLTLAEVYDREYRAIRGQPHKPSRTEPFIYGRSRSVAARSLFFPTPR